MKKFTLALGLLISAFASSAADMSRGADNFYKSDKVTQQKVTFKNQYQMAVVGNLFIPKTMGQNTRHPAIVVGHPLRNRVQIFMRRSWRSRVLSRWLSISLSGEKARANRGT